MGQESIMPELLFHWINIHSKHISVSNECYNFKFVLIPAASNDLIFAKVDR